MNYEVLIIGGGVIGLSIARELAGRGIDRVAVVERGRVGREASYAAAGMLAPNAENEKVDDLYRLCDASRKMFPGLSAQLIETTGINIELDRSGTLYSAFTEKDLEHIDRRFSSQTEAGIPVQRLTAAEMLSQESNISDSVLGGLFFPNDWQVENRKLVAALRADVVRLGVEVIEDLEVGCLNVRNGRVLGIANGGSSIASDVTVLATGAWTSLIKTDGAALPAVRPIRGQMISFAATERMFTKVIYSPRGYLVPRADGRILIGATVEDVGFERKVTDKAIEELRQAGFEIAPGLRNLKVAESWAGFRPYSDDGLPIIGEVPGYEGLLAATGHYRNGILLAPITAKLIADRIVYSTHSEFLRIFGADRAATLGLNACT